MGLDLRPSFDEKIDFSELLLFSFGRSFRLKSVALFGEPVSLESHFEVPPLDTLAPDDGALLLFMLPE